MVPQYSPVKSGSYLGKLPGSTTLSAFTGPQDTLEAMTRIAHGPRGEQSVLVRQFLEHVVREVTPKDYLGEILAIRNVLVQPSPWRPGVPLFRYTNDPRHVEWIKDPQRIVEEIYEHGSALLDCDESTLLLAVMALQLGREVELVALGFTSGQLTHVGARVKEPKSGRWIWCDSVAGPREREAAQSATEVKFWSLD